MRCIVLDDYQDAALRMADWSVLAGRVEVESLREHIADRQTLARRLADADVVVAMRERTPFDRALFAMLPKLRLLVTTGMANASIDLSAAVEHGVTVCGTGGASGSTVELAWGLIIALARHIPREHQTMRENGLWQTTLGRGLEGRTLGIVGTGRLGSRMIPVARAFGMPVVAWSRSLTDARAAEFGATRAADVGALLEASDIVSLHLRLTPETRGLIGAAELARMRPGAFLVNTARGPLVDEAALVEALRTGRLAGAALDVFDEEPLPAQHPLRDLPNVVTTPHLGYVTEETYRTYFAEAVEDIAAWLDGAPKRVLATPR